MITITVQSAFVLYLAIMLVLLVVLAIHEWWYNRANAWHISEESLCRCADCHFTFVVRRRIRNARCPRCDKLCSIPRKIR